MFLRTSSPFPGSLLCGVLAAGALLCAPAARAGDELVPVGPSFKLNTNLTYTQYQAQVDSDADGELWTAVWSSPLGADIYMREFNGNGVPVTPEKKVDATFGTGNQSEPEVCTDEFGNFMIAWSDFSGNDGSLMGIFGRVYAANGNAKGPDFLVNQFAPESQWEPKGDAMPGGGFVMGWSGTSDGDAFIRIFDAQGVPLTGEIQTNVQSSNAQIDTAVAAGRTGTILVAYEDFGGYSGVVGQDIWVRAFTKTGQPLQPIETLLNSSTKPGNQHEPRIAADGLGHFIVVYEDDTSDGSGSAIYARRYAANGTPLGAEFRVNQVTAGNQVRPDVAADWVGNFVVSWEDHSTGRGLATLRRFDASGAPLTGDITVDASLPGDEHFPSVTMDWAGQDVTVTFAANDQMGDPMNEDDIFARRFRASPLTLGGSATPGGTFNVALDLPSGAGLGYVLLPSLSTLPGLPLPDGRKVHLSYDTLMSYGLGFPNGPSFFGLAGALDAGGAASVSVVLPSNAILIGLTLQFAAVSLDLSQTTLYAQLRHVTDPLAVTIQ